MAETSTSATLEVAFHIPTKKESEVYDWVGVEPGIRTSVRDDGVQPAVSLLDRFCESRVSGGVC